jgi:hypothetical protein
MRVLLCLLALGLVAAEAAEVRMRDGRVLDGIIDHERSSETQLALAVSSGRLTAILNLPRKDILHLDPAPSPRQRRLEAIDAEAGILGSGGSAAAWWDLAERAAALDPIRHTELATITLQRDRHHGPARASLGYARVNGIWMLNHERAAAEGLVLHEGRWMGYDAYLAQVQAEERAAAAEPDRERRRQRIRRVRTFRSAYSYGCSLSLPQVFTGSYRGFHGLGPDFIPSASTRRAGGRSSVPSGGGIVPPNGGGGTVRP